MVARLGQRSGPCGVGRCDELQQQSVTDEDHGGKGDARAYSAPDEQHRREHPCQSDAAQYARQAQCCEVEVEQPVVDQSQRHQRQSAADYLRVDASFADSFFALFGQREGKRNARDEEEQRENGVVVEESVPRGVPHLGRHPVGETPGPEFAQGDDEPCEAHDEEHVKTPQGVEREKPLRGGRFGRLRFHRCRIPALSAGTNL